MISIEDTYKEMGYNKHSQEDGESPGSQAVNDNKNKSMTIIEEESLEDS